MEIGLALSGGGIRAAVFHLGVLRRLADESLLESVTQVSTVSGGSLVIAAVISKAGMQWPRSADYQDRLFPELRHLVTTSDLFSFRTIGSTGLLRFNHRLFGHRAQVLAELLAERWSVDGAIRDLPDRPVWWINATCLETGRNWRFGKREMGDWQFGRHYDPPYYLAEAAAASAAVPYVIGALHLRLPAEGWYRTDPATRQPIEKSRPPTLSVHLWDGGAYENLGLESLYKPRQGLLGCDFLICSDASGPSEPLTFLPWPITWNSFTGVNFPKGTGISQANLCAIGGCLAGPFNGTNFFTANNASAFTKVEVFEDNRLTLDVSKLAWGKPGILDAYVGYRYWYNKFGTDHNAALFAQFAPGTSIESTAYIGTTYHFR